MLDSPDMVLSLWNLAACRTLLFSHRAGAFIHVACMPHLLCIHVFLANLAYMRSPPRNPGYDLRATLRIGGGVAGFRVACKAQTLNISQPTNCWVAARVPTLQQLKAPRSIQLPSKLRVLLVAMVGLTQPTGKGVAMLSLWWWLAVNAPSRIHQVRVSCRTKTRQCLTAGARDNSVIGLQCAVATFQAARKRAPFRCRNDADFKVFSQHLRRCWSGGRF